MAQGQRTGKRPKGVTISALMALGASSLLGLFAMGNLVMGLFPSEIALPGATGFVLWGLLLLIPAICTLVTAIGLLRLRPWGRIAALIIAAILIPVGLVPVLVVFAAVTFGPEIRRSPAEFLDVVVPPLIGLAVGISWLIYFGRKPVAAVFEGR